MNSPRPIRFQNHHRLTPKELMAYTRIFMRGVSQPTDEQAKSLERALSIGDPLADRWIDYAHHHFTLEEGRQWVNRAIQQGIHTMYKPPSCLKELFDHLEEVPLWLDEDLLSLARDTVRRSGPLGNWLLVNVALMGGYRYEGVIQPLLMTGRLTDDAARRLAETTQFVRDILAEGGLKRGGVGYTSIVRVRLLHSHIRFHLNRHPQWSSEKWGYPVNQADMLATQLLFSLSYLVTARTLGISFTAREALSVVHLWRYVGRLLGIQDHLLAATEEEARRMFYLVGITQSLAGDEAALLGKALHEVPLSIADKPIEHLAARASTKIRAGLSHLFLGEEGVEHLGVPKTKFRYLMMGAVPLVFMVDRLRAYIPGGTALSTKVGGVWQDWQANWLLNKTQNRKQKNEDEMDHASGEDHR